MPAALYGDTYHQTLAEAFGCGQAKLPCGDVDPCAPHHWVEYIRHNGHPLWADGTIKKANVVAGGLVASGDNDFLYTSPIIDAGEYDSYKVELQGKGDNPIFEYRAAKTFDGVGSQAFVATGPLPINFRYIQYRAIVRAV